MKRSSFTGLAMIVVVLGLAGLANAKMLINVSLGWGDQYYNHQPVVPNGTVAAAPSVGKNVWQYIGISPKKITFPQWPVTSKGMIDSNGEPTGVTGSFEALWPTNQKAWSQDAKAKAFMNFPAATWNGGGGNLATPAKPFRDRLMLQGLNPHGKYDLYIYSAYVKGDPKTKSTVWLKLAAGTAKVMAYKYSYQMSNPKLLAGYKLGTNYEVFKNVRPNAQGKIVVLGAMNNSSIFNAFQLYQAHTGHVTVLHAVLKQPACRPGYQIPVDIRWNAQPMGRDFTVFVHCLGADGNMAFQADYHPPVSTSVWSGRVNNLQRIYVPITAKDGQYKITVGLYNQAGRVKLHAGKGVIALGQDAYQVGIITVAANAPLPKLPPKNLNLKGYHITFNDNFHKLSISTDGPGTRWFTATKGTFGNAAFMPEKNGFPFAVKNGMLRIAAVKKHGQWQAGIIASVNTKGQGFAQKYGYFVMRAKFPGSLGTWPAFWLLGQPAVTNPHVDNPEIDVVEHYGVLPHLDIGTLHVWAAKGPHWGKGDDIDAPGMDSGFHNYGVMVTPRHVTWYFDGRQFEQQKTPQAAKVPLYMLVNLAMGGGWPIDQAVSPAYMYVKYVRVYAKDKP
ncbi:MAG: glycoside hydrolase family 16 protein [Phycisphaerae bacterium]|nr:glycoside hydrolase family 16 protein [Phycisphaerae bacterium]